jgi:hypothetical protein
LEASGATTPVASSFVAVIGVPTSDRAVDVGPSWPSPPQAASAIVHSTSAVETVASLLVSMNVLLMAMSASVRGR